MPGFGIVQRPDARVLKKQIMYQGGSGDVLTYATGQVIFSVGDQVEILNGQYKELDVLQLVLQTKQNQAFLDIQLEPIQDELGFARVAINGLNHEIRYRTRGVTQQLINTSGEVLQARPLHPPSEVLLVTSAAAWQELLPTTPDVFTNLYVRATGGWHLLISTHAKFKKISSLLHYLGFWRLSNLREKLFLENNNDRQCEYKVNTHIVPTLVLQR